MRPFSFAPILIASAATAFATGCSGSSNGGGSLPGGTPSASPSPILVVGSVRRYTGTDSITRTYASPGPSTPNFTASYALAQTTTVNAAAAGAPAPYDVSSVLAYTTLQAPPNGTAPQSTTTDTYENQIASGSSLQLIQAGSHSVALDDDVTADATGGGPYTLTTTTTTTYAAPQTIGTFPLVAGTTYAQPIARTVVATATLANASGGVPTTVIDTNTNATYNADGSYTRTATLSNGQSQTFVQSTNGGATLAASGPVLAEQETIGTPTSSTGGTVIPISVTTQTPTQSAPVTKTYAAVDWYPGGGAPTLPFDVVTVTVKGPVTTLPAGCSGAAPEPNLVEIDQAENSLNLFGSLTVTQQQRFDSNGIAACTLRTVTTTDYDIQTGLQSEVSTEQFALVLQSVGTSSLLRSKH